MEAAYDEVEIWNQVSTFWKKQEWQDSLKHYYRDNPEILKHIETSSKYCHTVQLLNSFTHNGPNGKHYVMVFKVLGVNLLEIIKRYDYKGIPLHLVRILTKQWLIGLDYMNRIWKLIHTDLKPENVVIWLTKEEKKEIRDKGVLKTTKMYHQDEKQIERAIAGAHDNIILSHREYNKEDELPSRKQTEGTQSEIEMAKDTSQHAGKNNKKKQQYKKKQKNIKKFIKQGKLPHNYSELSKEEKDKLYNELCPNIQQNEAKDSNKNEVGNNEETKDEDNVEINIEHESIGILDSTQMTTNTDFNKTNTDFKESSEFSMLKESSKVIEKQNEEIKQNKESNINEEIKPKNEVKPPKVKSPTKWRPSSVPHKADWNDDEEKELEKLKQLMGDGMEDTPTKPNIPKINTDMLKYQEKMFDKATKRGPKIDENVNIAIVDMGNGWWTHHHFTSQIQTRQYRSPETIIGVPYSASADIWSLAWMVFELLTGDFLFEPRKGYYYDKDDDHLAQMVELLGPMPKNFALSGKNSKRYFDSTGHLRRIRGLNYWPLSRVLTEKYRFRPNESEALADFLQSMLTWYPDRRATAQEMLDHPWLTMPRNDNYKLSEEEYETLMIEIKNKEETEK